MKNYFFKLTFVSIALFAQPPVGNANKGEEYGAGVSKTKEAGAVSMAELSKILNERKEVQDITVKATVTDVCPKKDAGLR